MCGPGHPLQSEVGWDCRILYSILEISQRKERIVRFNMRLVKLNGHGAEPCMFGEPRPDWRRIRIPEGRFLFGMRIGSWSPGREGSPTSPTTCVWNRKSRTSDIWNIDEGTINSRPEALNTCISTQQSVSCQALRRGYGAQKSPGIARCDTLARLRDTDPKCRRKAACRQQ